MKLSFHGAARTVTGSKHILTLNDGRKILLDCGMFQGMGAETEDLNHNFGFNPADISILLLSHAHIDHTGLIPKLVKEGFNGKIMCTQATKDLTDILLHDSAEIQTYETELINKRREKKGLRPYEPLYTSDDVNTCLSQFETVEYNTWVKIFPDVEVYYTNTGHLIGSAAITIRVKEGRKKTSILFSGDVGRYRSVLLQPPAETPPADYIILESTYGDKRHDISFNIIKDMRQWIERICVEQGGQLIIPAFSVGRTQEVLYALNQLSLEKRLPELFVFVDSPLSMKATETIKQYAGQFNERLQQVLAIDDDPFSFPGLKYIETVEDSRKLVDYKEPCIIISASGTADAGRVRHHINSCVGEKNCAILFVGYCGAKSLGGQLLSGKKEVEIFYDDPSKVAAEVGQMHGMSAHGDTDDLSQFISHQNAEKVKGIFLVHGEQAVQKAFADRLTLKGFQRIECPAQHQEFELPLPRKRKRIPVATTETASA
ncbi:MAG TPA: MBL fold metallo-hydrolase [Flavisolibacter sp.]|nr:MBL fold metallo-hydrolase [Flavisolibacter sp.]